MNFLLDSVLIRSSRFSRSSPVFLPLTFTELWRGQLLQCLFLWRAPLSALRCLPFPSMRAFPLLPPALPLSFFIIFKNRDMGHFGLRDLLLFRQDRKTGTSESSEPTQATALGPAPQPLEGSGGATCPGLEAGHHRACVSLTNPQLTTVSPACHCHPHGGCFREPMC